MKVCFKCREAKALSEFYRHSAMGDGHLGKCKECTKRDTKEARMARIDHYRAYDKRRASMPHRKTLAQAIQKRWRAQHPLRSKAQASLRRAMLAGKILRLPCQICGEKAEAHHPDYSNPLSVVWLCPPHHKQAHVLARAA